jgi:hypothetical protein
MPDSIRPGRSTRTRRAPLVTTAALAAGVLLTACGGNTSTTQPRTAANVAATTTTAAGRATGGGTTSAGLPTPGPDGSALAFARCMRANGVPNFPDPLPGRGLLFSAAGINPAAPVVKAAQAKCRRLLPLGGPPSPGTTTHPSSQTLAKLVRIARCMRDHGVPQFPDPRTSVPSNPSGIQVITDFDGAILLFPSTLNRQAPAYKQALAACGAPPLGLPH